MAAAALLCSKPRLHATVLVSDEVISVADDMVIWPAPAAAPAPSRTCSPPGARRLTSTTSLNGRRTCPESTSSSGGLRSTGDKVSGTVSISTAVAAIGLPAGSLKAPSDRCMYGEAMPIMACLWASVMSKATRLVWPRGSTGRETEKAPADPAAAACPSRMLILDSSMSASAEFFTFSLKNTSMLCTDRSASANQTVGGAVSDCACACPAANARASAAGSSATIHLNQATRSAGGGYFRRPAHAFGANVRT